jgi:hypothetical protein
MFSPNLFNNYYSGIYPDTDMVAPLVAQSLQSSSPPTVIFVPVVHATKEQVMGEQTTKARKIKASTVFIDHDNSQYDRIHPGGYLYKRNHQASLCLHY